MRPEGSLPCSQKPVIRPYPEPDESSPHMRIYLKICFVCQLIFKEIITVKSDNQTKFIVKPVGEMPFLSKTEGDSAPLHFK